MKEIPLCPRCKQYYIPSATNPECSYCANTEHSSILDASPKIVELNKKLFTSEGKPIKKSNIVVHPPPIPKPDTRSYVEQARSINVSIRSNEQIESQSEKTILFRRGIVLVFEPDSFELILQQPWIKKILQNELQIIFERNFTREDGNNHTMVTILRLKIVYANLFKNNLKDFLKEKTIHDEMSFRLTNAFVVVKDEPLTKEWNEFLDQSSQKKYIYYLSRGASNSSANIYSLMESETLFISLIKRILIIQDRIVITIKENKQGVRIAEPMSFVQPIQEYKTSKLEIFGFTTNCMGHGGPAKEYSTCQTCGGSLCDLCVDSFLICPGSIASDLHKFIKK